MKTPIVIQLILRNGKLAFKNEKKSLLISKNNHIHKNLKP